MATMHGHGKGKSRSHSPKAEKPYWLKLEPKEIEDLVMKLAKEGMTSDKIGLVLRDSYSIPNVKSLTKKKISKILKDNGINEDSLSFKNLQKKEENIKRHLKGNQVDKTAKKGLQLTQAKLHRLKKYYKMY
jgi:small subunit ribosomal protein S15